MDSIATTSATVSSSISSPSTSMENTTMTTPTSTTEQYEISPGIFVDKETYDIIRGADAHVVKQTKNLIPEIKIVSTDIQMIDFSNLLGMNIIKGSFIAISYDENGDKVYRLLPPTFNAIIIKHTNAYTLYDETAKESTYYSNEYEFGVQPRIMIKEADSGKVMFDGTQKTVKDYLVKYFPGKVASDGRQTHQFSFRNIIYVVLPDLIRGENNAGAVYRLMLSHTALDTIRQFKETISGDPMKYMVEFSTTPKMGVSSLFYPINIRLAGGIELLAKLGIIASVAKIKRDLDEYILEAQNHFFNVDSAKAEQLAAVQSAPALPPQAITPAAQPATVSDLAMFDGI